MVVECDICGSKLKNNASLKSHKARQHEAAKQAAKQADEIIIPDLAQFGPIGEVGRLKQLARFDSRFDDVLAVYGKRIGTRRERDQARVRLVQQRQLGRW